MGWGTLGKIVNAVKIGMETIEIIKRGGKGRKQPKPPKPKKPRAAAPQ